MKGWFIIDFAAVFPFDKVIQAILIETSGGKYNSLIRVTRIGKLYKLVKITRLIRVLKLFKSKGKLFKQLNSFFSLGEGFERLVFTLLIFLMLSHFMACFWIFTAQLSTN